MLFSSLTFLFGFFPILLVLYFIISNRKIKNYILLIFSLIFYAWGEPKYIVVMIVTTLVSYLAGLLIDKFNKNIKKKKIILAFSVILIVSSLMFFKYSNFLIENINVIFGMKVNSINVLLPIGISFYTFQILSYLIDLYRGKIKLQKNFSSLMLYVSFFPQLIAGPIVRYETIEEEINNRKENFDDFVYGVKRFILGLSKKVLIANNMAVIADFIFNNYNSSFGTSIVWIGALAYTLQIYFDFSGYSDMAIGIGRMFGFHFLENFDYPYVSKSITEFWRRWHMSLSSWFRDYIYIPLGGNRVSKIKWIRNILVVWALTGFWHGASWNFILWGLFYGILLLFEKLFILEKTKKIPDVVNWFITMIIVICGWTIFRANSLTDIIYFFQNMFVYKRTDWLAIIADNAMIFSSLIYFIPAIVFSFPIVRVLNTKYSNKILYVVISNITLIGLLLLCVVMLVSSSYNPFIYFRF